MHIDKQVALKDVFALLVLLGRFLGNFVFPAEGRSTLDTVDISDSVLTRGHGAVTRFAFLDVNYFLKEIGSPMLSIKGSRHHRSQRSEMGLACRAPVYARSSKILAKGHSHVGGGAKTMVRELDVRRGQRVRRPE